MLPQFGVEGIEEHLICDFPHIHAGIIQNGNDPFVLLLHQVHNNLVVEVINLQETKGQGCWRPWLQKWEGTSAGHSSQCDSKEPSALNVQISNSR